MNREVRDLVAAHGIPVKERIPFWLVIFGLVLVLAGGSFWWDNTADFRADVYDLHVTQSQDGILADPMTIGRRLYTRNCAVCHLQNGEGLEGQFPPLAGSEWVLAEGWSGDNHLVKIVLQGMHGPVTVRGKSYNNSMVPWGQVMNDNQVAAVLTYIRQSWGNRAPSISADFVAGIRAKTRLRSEPWTEKTLQSIPREMQNRTFAPGDPAPQ